MSVEASCKPSRSARRPVLSSTAEQGVGCQCTPLHPIALICANCSFCTTFFAATRIDVGSGKLSFSSRPSVLPHFVVDGGSRRKPLVRRQAGAPAAISSQYFGFSNADFKWQHSIQDETFQSYLVDALRAHSNLKKSQQISTKHACKKLGSFWKPGLTTS